MLLLEQFENLTLHPKNAARLKELVLQLAVQGKLTENWRRQNSDVESAAELLKRIELEKAQLVKEKKIKKEKTLEPVLEDNMPHALPESWVWCRLSKIILDTDAGKSPQCDNRPADPDEFGFIKTTAIQSLQFLPDENKAVLKADHTNLKYEIKPGDILITRAGPRNRVGVVCAVTNTRNKLLLSDKTVRISLVAGNPVNARFLAITLSTGASGNFLESKKSGMADSQVNITQDNIKLTPVALPPLAEQEAIVARVEELMRKIEELEKQTAERIQLKQHLGTAALQQLTATTDEELEQNWLFLKQHFQTMFDEAENVKRLRETILQLAVQGKLTATWRKYNPTTEPASELLKRIQTEKAQLVKEKKIKKEKPLEPISENEVPYTLPEGWAWCRLSTLSNLITSGSRDWAKYYSNEGAKFVRMGNLSKGSFELRLANIQYVLPPNDTEGNRTKLEENDVLISITGDVGMLGLIPKDFGEAYINQHTALVRVSRSLVHKFVAYTFLSQLLQEQFNEPQRGIKNSFRLSDIDNLIFPLPPLTEQEAIVAKVDQLMHLCSKLELQIQQSKQETEALMQAVVQEALQVQSEIVF